MQVVFRANIGWCKCVQKYLKNIILCFAMGKGMTAVAA